MTETGDRQQAKRAARPRYPSSGNQAGERKDKAPTTVPLILSPVAITAPTVRPSSGAKRVLVVDDNADAAEDGGVLGIMGYQARLAHDGPTALEAARSYQPQVVFWTLACRG